ncbi:MAG: hypothetical protein IJ757_03535 [Clostridiales bacterium]|nr:hypothetical protein [Clostridiales bacterium]
MVLNKRIVAAVMTAVMAFGFTSCDKGGSGNGGSSDMLSAKRLAEVCDELEFDFVSIDEVESASAVDGYYLTVTGEDEIQELRDSVLAEGLPLSSYLMSGTGEYAEDIEAITYLNVTDMSLGEFGSHLRVIAVDFGEDSSAGKLWSSWTSVCKTFVKSKSQDGGEDYLLRYGDDSLAFFGRVSYSGINSYMAEYRIGNSLLFIEVYGEIASFEDGCAELCEAIGITSPYELEKVSWDDWNAES